MSSVVDICKMALSSIRAKTINSIEGSSVEAQQCALHYPLARRQLLTDYDWGFNSKRQGLALLSGVTVFNWAYVWSYPSDCLHVNYLIRNVEEVAAGGGSYRIIPDDIHDNRRHESPATHPPVEYQIYNDSTHGRIICSIESDLRVDYRADIEDTALFSIDFELALGYLLASMVAVPILGADRGKQMRDDALALYAGFIDKAKTKSANQRHRPQMESDYIRVRQGHGNG